MFSRLIFAASLAGLAAACSNHDVYNALQGRDRHECEQLREDERKACLQSTAQSYEEYRQEREKAVNAE